MKYQQRDFTSELREKIKNTELELKNHIERLLSKNKLIFNDKNLSFNAGFEKVGNDPFKPGYCSSVSIGISDENGELIDLHIIKIWECELSFLGIPTSKKLPGSKIIGEFLDESLKEIKIELKEYIEEQLVNIT